MEVIASGIDVPIAILLPFTITIEHEVLEAIGEVVIGEKAKVVVVELELRGILSPDLVHEIEKLKEDRREAGLVRRCLVGPVREAMAEGEPLAFDQRLKAVEGAVEGIEEEFADRHQLGAGVPPVLHADHHRRGVILAELNDVHADQQDLLQLVEPTRFFDQLEKGHRVRGQIHRGVRRLSGGELRGHAGDTRPGEFLETRLDLTDIVEFQGEKAIVLELFQPAGAMLSAIADDVQRRTLVHLKNSFVEVDVEVRRDTSHPTGRHRGGRGGIHRIVTRRVTAGKSVRTGEIV